MDKLFKILLVSGVIGILISSLTNLFISLRGLREQRRAQNFSARLDFFRTKLTSLTSLRDALYEHKSVRRIHDIINFLASAKDEEEKKVMAAEWLDFERSNHTVRVDLYRKNRYLFSQAKRTSLDATIEKIEVPEMMSDLWIVWECSKSEPTQRTEKTTGLSPERMMEIGLKILSHRFDLIHQFEGDLLLATENELDAAANVLSRDSTSA